MSEPAAPSAPAKKSGLFRTILVGMLGLSGGAIGTYTTAVVEKIAKPPLPIANFAAAADGLAVTCMNHATGDTGWWDFGDGSPLEPFAADQPTVAHTYAKPGSYAVKLTVRNFTADENDRTVTVDVAAPAAKDAAAAPHITGFAVQPMTPGAVAPATFRITAEVQNADYCVWDFGDGRVEAAEGGGKIDRTVTFDTPGTATVQLVAHTGKAAAQQSAAVKVEAAPVGTLTAVLKVTDGGKRAERHTRNLTLAVPAPKDKAATFTRTISARPGATLVEVVAARPDIPGVKNLRVAVAPDKKSATITGEWADPKNAKAGSDALIPLKLTDERAVSRPPATAVVTGQLPPLSPAGKTSTAIALPAPPAPLDGMSRTVHVELRQTGSNGKPVVIAEGELTGRGPVSIPARQYVSLPMPPVATATFDTDRVTIAFEVRSAVVPASGP
jgi:hypothetical protein